MGNPVLKELRALKQSCDTMLLKDREIFGDDELLLRMAQNSCYKAFYEIAADILKKYEELEEKEAADYENYLYGGKEND